MRFDTLYFFVIFVGAYSLWRTLPAKAATLLIASAGMYYLETGRRDTAIFFVLIVVNYGFSFFVQHRAWLALAIASNIAVLAVFKYRDFFLAETAFSDLARWGYFANTLIPLGISFYTFQAIAYFIDIYRGHTAIERRFHRFFLFKSFFPQLIAGPIVRANELLPQLARQWDGVARQPRLVVFGLGLACVGVLKKVVLADSISPFVDDIFTAGPANAFTAWLGAALFAFQIYFDFSGYSDMALGMACLIGIRLPLNFRQPYLSASPQEFWQRWHITLSRWIRDYLYIPLGGSRRGGPIRRIAVVVFVMAAAGFWHGAAWTFIAWGLGWGLAIVIWRALPLGLLPRRVGWGLTTLIAVALWVPFRSTGLAEAGSFLGTMVGLGPTGASDYTSAVAVASGAVAILFGLHCVEAAATGRSFLLFLRRFNGPMGWGCLVGIILWLLAIPKIVNAPFIYFRF